MGQEQNPWQNQDDKPKNIDEWVDQGLKRFSELIKGGNGSNGSGNPPTNDKKPRKNLSGLQLLAIIGAVILGLIIYNSAFQIQPGETGVVLRFGEHNRNAPPGLNFLLPFAEDLTKVNIEAVRSIEFVYNGSSSAAPSYDNVASMITSDRNVININWVVQYRIKDPEDYLFHIVNVTNAIKDFSEYVVRRLVGNRDFDYILNRREELAFAAFEEIQSLLDKYNSGVELVTLQLLDVTPPEPVRPAFNEVNEADQDKTRLVNEAQREANQRIPKARGDAQRTILEAEGYAIQRVNEAEGNVSRFNSIYDQYQNFRDVTRTQLYIDTMRQVLPGIEDILVVDKEGNLLPLLNLQKSSNLRGN